jgi:hypothetical protein
LLWFLIDIIRHMWKKWGGCIYEKIK